LEPSVIHTKRVMEKVAAVIQRDREIIEIIDCMMRDSLILKTDTSADMRVKSRGNRGA
jgi:hypothetical protein